MGVAATPSALAHGPACHEAVVAVLVVCVAVVGRAGHGMRRRPWRRNRRCWRWRHGWRRRRRGRWRHDHDPGRGCVGGCRRHWPWGHWPWRGCRHNWLRRQRHRHGWRRWGGWRQRRHGWLCCRLWWHWLRRHWHSNVRRWLRCSRRHLGHWRWNNHWPRHGRQHDHRPRRSWCQSRHWHRAQQGWLRGATVAKVLAAPLPLLHGPSAQRGTIVAGLGGQWSAKRRWCWCRRRRLLWRHECCQEENQGHNQHQAQKRKAALPAAPAVVSCGNLLLKAAASLAHVAVALPRLVGAPSWSYVCPVRGRHSPRSLAAGGLRAAKAARAVTSVPRAAAALIAGSSAHNIGSPGTAAHVGGGDTGHRLMEHQCGHGCQGKGALLPMHCLTRGH